jgi:hypothetical protein
MKEFIEYLGEKLNLDKSICVHNYKDFKRTEKGQKMIDTFVERWQRFGFIEGLEGEIRERCAVAMEQLAIYLITEAVEKELSSPFETIGFPMIRRICCGSIGDNVKLNDLDLFNFEKFLKYSKELDVVGLIEEVNNLPHYNQIDVEAEACALACEMMIKRFNGDDRSFKEIKTEYINKIKEKMNKRNEGTSSDNTNA